MRAFCSEKSAEELWEKMVIDDEGLELSIVDEITPTDDPNVRELRIKIGNGLFAIRSEEIIRSEKPF